jgi:pimeloyl-ACP methyl ester carboxylesterase
MRRSKTLLSLLLLLTTSPLWAADPAATETRVGPTDPRQVMLEALKTAPLQGEKLELKVGGNSSFALFLDQTSSKPQGGVILLHDQGSHLDIAAVIHPLRTRLPEKGWATLSIQLQEVGDKGIDKAWLTQSQQTIAAAIDEMSRRNITNLALVGHGLGALAATNYLAAGDNLLIKGLVIIGMDGTPRSDPDLDGAALLAKVRQPILDLFGALDLAPVLTSASRRALAAQRKEGADSSAHTLYRDVAKGYTARASDSITYRQLRIAAADHDFSGQEPQLVRRVLGWLDRTAPGMEKTVTKESKK